MTQNKKQHYVPQYYLRNFSEDSYNVRIFHLKSGKIKTSPIASTCQESYFYGSDGEFENLMTKMDDHHSRVINNILKLKSLPSDLDESIALLEFLLVQHTRTRLEREIVNSYGNAFCDRYIKPTMRYHLKSRGLHDEEIEGYSVKITNMDIFHKRGIFNAFNSIIGIRDLVPCFFENRTMIPFISSDSPVIFNNRIRLDNNFTGILSRGLQIHCPLSPSLYLMLYDPAFYSIDPTIPPSLRDIDRLNALQLLNCNEILIASVDITQKYLNNLNRRHGWTKKEKIAKIKIKRSEWLDDTTRSDIDELSIENANCHVNFDFLKFNHQAFREFKRYYVKIKKNNPNTVFPRDPESVEELKKYQKEINDRIKKYNNN